MMCWGEGEKTRTLYTCQPVHEKLMEAQLLGCESGVGGNVSEIEI